MKLSYPGESLTLTSATRKPADGDFVALPSGVTHYQLAGPAAASTVVLICGFSVPYFVFDPTFAALTAAGLRVLRYDLYGRGWSDRPQLRYSAGLFRQQLAHLLDSLSIRRASLVGLSMGGPIAATFVAEAPERVDHLVLIDPCGARDLALPWFLRLARFPLLGELAMALLGTSAILRAVANDFVDQSLVAMFLEKYRTQMRFKGFRRALLSTVRAGMLDTFLDTYRRVGEQARPTMLIWGTEDRTVPFEHSAILRSAMPKSRLEAIPGSGHIPHIEQPGAVNPLLVDFLQ